MKRKSEEEMASLFPEVSEVCKDIPKYKINVASTVSLRIYN